MSIEELDFKDGLIPVIAQDLEGQVLMQAYANEEALHKTLETKNAWYWSRKRNKLWMKGEESGNVQKILGVYTDCDKDSLLYVVEQTGGACHKGTYSCFTEQIYGKKAQPVLEEVFEVIKERKRLRPSGSYVSSIIDDEERLIGKIREESEELIEAFEGNGDLVWEAADLIFHTFLLLANKDVEWESIVKEARRRRK